MWMHQSVWSQVLDTHVRLASHPTSSSAVIHFLQHFCPFHFSFFLILRAHRRRTDIVCWTPSFCTEGWNKTTSIIHVQIVANCRVTHPWDQPTGIVTQLVSGIKKLRVSNPIDYWTSVTWCNSITLFKGGETSLCSTPGQEPRASVQWVGRLACKFSRKYIIRKVLEQLRAKP